jgi:hypothetical protein
MRLEEKQNDPAVSHGEMQIGTNMKQEDIDDHNKRTGQNVSGDRAQREFGEGSLRNHTNQFGTNGYKFQLTPAEKAVSSEFLTPEALRTAKHPVQDFFVYDGAQPTIGHTGKTYTRQEHVLPNKRIKEEDAIEWNRVGSKKGWMFNGMPQEEYGHSGENVPTHTDDGYVDTIKNHKWQPLMTTDESQGLSQREQPDIYRTNLARGIGVSRGGYGSMAGGYKQVTQERLRTLAKPMAKYNHTGSRKRGTGRTDAAGTSSNAGAGGYRAGYASVYPSRPSIFKRGDIPPSI